MRFISRLHIYIASSLLTVACGLSPAMAAAPAVALVEDYSFKTLAVPEPVSTGNKIEVLEVFSYGCVHCFEYQPAVRAFVQHLPKDVALALMPATFNGNFKLYARGFFAAQALGVAEKLHEQVFAAVWEQGRPANNLEGLADLYASLGVDRDQFLAAAHSVGVEARLSAATEKSERVRLEGTPTFYVDGKYQVLTNGAQNYDEIFARVDALVARARVERAAARKASPQAGPKAGAQPDAKAAR